MTARSELATMLKQFVRRLETTQDAPNDQAHDFERTGLLMIRAGLTLVYEGDRARKFASEWSCGVSAASDDSTHSSTPSSPTERAALRGWSDHWENVANMLDLERRLLDDNARAIETRITTTVAISAKPPRKPLVVVCGNQHCETEISGIDDDRPRRGRCPRCFKFLTRNGRDWTPRQDACA